MRVWRIANPGHAMDRTCQGTAMHGGRWNPIGTPMLYAASSISLAAMEKFVHLESAPWPNQVLAAIDIPGTSPLYSPEPSDLPAGWDAMPTSSAAQAFGRNWINSTSSLAMAVPSVGIPEERIVLLNPFHRDYAGVTMSIIRPFDYDKRMKK